MNLGEVMAGLSKPLREDQEANPVARPTRSFYQMACRSSHYYRAKAADQLPLREIEGFCKVQVGFIYKI